MILVVVLGGMVAAATSARARERAPVTLEGTAGSFPLERHIAILDDPGGGLGIDRVAGRDDFLPTDRPGLTTGTRWVRFTAIRGAGMAADWILAFGEPDIDDVRVFVPRQDEGGFTELRLGRHLPGAQLPVAARRHLAPLVLPEGRPLTVYVRLASHHKIRFEDAALWRPGALMFAEARQSALHAIQFGGLAVMVAVYALFGLWLRDGAMLLYSAYVATILCRGGTHTGIVALVFPASGGLTNYLLSGIGLLGSIAVFILMWDRILDLRTTFPRMHRLYLLAGGAVAASLPAVTTPAFSLAVRPAQAIMLAAGIGSVVMASLLLRRDPRDVLLRFYVFAFLPIVLAWAVELAAALSPSVPSDLGRLIDVSATFAHIAILSVALAYRLGRLQRERMQAEATLAGERLARERMRTFVDMASHEFRTPLAVIDSAAQMLGLTTGPARPEIAGRIAIIRRSVRRLVNLIETCLAGERAEAMAVRVLATSPGEVLAQAAERNRLPDWPAPLVASVGVKGTCLADPDLLAIALDALIDNARRHGREDEPVEISVRAEGGRVVFIVEDRGPGVPADEAGRIFDKYYRGPSSVPGTGIGLHLVKTIAGLHGGEVAYRPRPGGGASFALAIPAGPAEPKSASMAVGQSA